LVRRMSAVWCYMGTWYSSTGLLVANHHLISSNICFSFVSLISLKRSILLHDTKLHFCSYLLLSSPSLPGNVRYVQSTLKLVLKANPPVAAATGVGFWELRRSGLRDRERERTSWVFVLGTVFEVVLFLFVLMLVASYGTCRIGSFLWWQGIFFLPIPLIWLVFIMCEYIIAGHWPAICFWEGFFLIKGWVSSAFFCWQGWMLLQLTSPKNKSLEVFGPLIFSQ
jgi:hypothetical protein